MITAKCIKESSEPVGWLGHDLTVGEEYEVSRISMGQSHTTVYLKDRNKSYNSVYLEFYENGKPLDIFKDKRFNPYI